MTALANIEAIIGGSSPLSAEGLSDAVWNRLLADMGVEGSAGEKLSKLLTLPQFLGLK
jgi:hypothetical protein